MALTPFAAGIAAAQAQSEPTIFSEQSLMLASLLVAVGAFLVIAFAVQVFYLGLGLRAMRRAAQKAGRNAVAVQRAFVYASDLTWSAVGADFKISPIWTNSGATPTRRLRISTNWKASHGEVTRDFDIIYARPPQSLFLGPAAKAEFGTIFVPMRDIEAAIEGRLYLHVWGRATYEDVFEDTKPHFFEFCHHVEVTGVAPDNIELQFTQFGRSNGSDEDSRQTDEAS